MNLGTLTTDAAGKVDVIVHDGHTPDVNCAEVGVFENTDQIRLACFLQRHNRAAL